MKTETHCLLQKYRYIYSMTYNERHDLFYKIIWDNSLNNYIEIFDSGKYIEFNMRVQNKHYNIMKLWHDFNSYRGKIIKKNSKIDALY